jgi:hypothetical protein
VLVFAILPPLQQFGIITGLTIVYAFLASVLVLPSLLAVWTKYVGPDDVFPAPDADDAATGAASEAGAAATGAGEGPSAERSLDRSVVAPGGTVTVTVETEGIDGRAVLYERTDGTPAFEDATPTPVRKAAAGQVVSAAFDGQNPTLTYTVTVPEDAADGERFGVDGALVVDGELHETGGIREVEVVADVFERVTASGGVSEADLSDAYAGFEREELTDAQLSRINQAWTREDD